MNSAKWMDYFEEQEEIAIKRGYVLLKEKTNTIHKATPKSAHSRKQLAKKKGDSK